MEKALMILMEQKLNALLYPRATVGRLKGDVGDFEDENDFTYSTKWDWEDHSHSDDGVFLEFSGLP